MADSDQRSAIYQHVINHCRPYRPKGLWSRLKIDCDLWELADTGQLLVDLEAEFGRAAIIDAGVATDEDSGSLRSNLGGTGSSTILCPMRKKKSSNPYDLVTAGGCLSGSLPLRAAAEDTWTTISRTGSRNAVFGVFSLEDLAVLRLASLPVVLASGLSTLSGPTLDQFGYVMGIKDENGQWPFAPVVEVSGSPKVQAAHPTLLQQGAVDANGTLAFQKTNRVCHTVLGRNAQAHMDMVGLQVPFQQLDPSLTTQLTQDRTHLLSQATVQHLPSVLWYDHNVILTLPLHVGQTLPFVHRSLLVPRGPSQERSLCTFHCARYTPDRSEARRVARPEAEVSGT